jgi:sulfur carrier protein
MRIELNGSHVELSEGATIDEAVTVAGADGDRRGVAVAVEGEVVPRAEWETTFLQEGQAVEVVRAIQGG